ncbi:MAG: histidine kinase dimerization/phospho-acceptor domain-containing protein, partial [Bacillota bacterium]
MKINSLRSKIFFGYLLIVLILIIVTIWSIINFISLSDAINNIMVENYHSIEASESMIESLERQDSGLLMIIDGHINEGSKTFKNNEKDFYKWLGRAEDNITIEGEENTINKIEDNYENYINLFEELNNLNEEDQRNFYYEEILPFFHDLKNNIRELRTLNQETMISAQERADNRAGNAIISTSVISVIAIIIAILSGLYLSNIILRSVKNLKSAVQKIADRNFEQKIEVKSKDEIGELAQEFNKMIERLQEYEKMNVNKLIAERDKSRAIVNNISSPLIVTDEENRLVLINEEARKLFELNQEHTGEHFLEVINSEELFNIIQENKDENIEENPNITISINDNKQSHFKVSCNTVSTGENNVKYNIILLEDITKLKEIDEMKSDFVSTVSHEFRTPLTSMNMGLSMLLDESVGSLNEEQKELMEAAYEDCERLNELVDDLLDLSKIESGKIKMEFNKTEIKPLLKATIKPFKKQAKDKDINLITEDIPDNLYSRADS